MLDVEFGAPRQESHGLTKSTRMLWLIVEEGIHGQIRIIADTPTCMLELSEFEKMLRLRGISRTRAPLRT